MASGAATSATGGSAGSQAASLDDRAWTARPWAAHGIRLLMFVGPLVSGFVAVSAAMALVPRPTAALLLVPWIALLVGVSAAGAHVVQGLTMRLAPLSALFRISLVFPDAAPSRFSIALRRGSVRTLEGRDGTSDGDQAAAEQLLALVAELSRHDRATRGHSERVRAYAVMLGEETGLERDELDKLNWAALIHDIGKLHVPEEILNKPDRPTAEEWDVLRRHPGAAAAHVETLRPWLGGWVDAATQHHERYDGDGYPDGLAGKDISLAGRLVSIADAYDVMTAPRSYKPGLPVEQARAELLKCAGTQFDRNWSGRSCASRSVGKGGPPGRSAGCRTSPRSSGRLPSPRRRVDRPSSLRRPCRWRLSSESRRLCRSRHRNRWPSSELSRQPARSSNRRARRMPCPCRRRRRPSPTRQRPASPSPPRPWP
ncbi:MAG: hypothetical protein DHS20C19_09380 [Acidimicrobiales bacterium]|nr:MAG: hypothetical protein DHS20C19_09380 [Acidimicrobiales bacterium]